MDLVNSGRKWGTKRKGKVPKVQGRGIKTAPQTGYTILKTDATFFSVAIADLGQVTPYRRSLVLDDGDLGLGLGERLLV